MAIFVTQFVKGEISGICDQCGREVYLQIFFRGKWRSFGDIGQGMVDAEENHRKECNGAQE